MLCWIVKLKNISALRMYIIKVILWTRNHNIAHFKGWAHATIMSPFRGRILHSQLCLGTLSFSNNVVRFACIRSVFGLDSLIYEFVGLFLNTSIIYWVSLNALNIARLLFIIHSSLLVLLHIVLMSTNLVLLAYWFWVIEYGLVHAKWLSVLLLKGYVVVSLTSRWFVWVGALDIVLTLTV
jgi:hypothetical protein